MINKDELRYHLEEARNRGLTNYAPKPTSASDAAELFVALGAQEMRLREARNEPISGPLKVFIAIDCTGIENDQVAIAVTAQKWVAAMRTHMTRLRRRWVKQGIKARTFHMIYMGFTQREGLDKRFVLLELRYSENTAVNRLIAKDDTLNSLIGM